VADELAGTNQLRKENKEINDALKKTEAELAQERQNRLEEQIQNLKTDITKALTERGPSPEVARLVQELENLKAQLVQNRFDYLDREIKELRTMKATGANQGAIDEQIRQIKAAAVELGLQPPSGTTMSPELQVQIKQMEINLQLQLEQMKDDRERRNREWELTIKKWDEERELKAREIDGKITVEREKTGLIGDFIKRVGGSFARATTDASQQIAAAGGKISNQVIEAEEGDFGEVPCPTPGCGKTVAIARDAVKAICANCGTIYPIQRIPKGSSVEHKIESESSG
jgi:hypothetical protein